MLQNFLEHLNGNERLEKLTVKNSNKPVTRKVNNKDDIIAALQRQQPSGAVPIWELEFHLWDIASGRHVVLGEEFNSLSAAEQDKALHTNAEIFLTVAKDMHFAAITVPSRYWEISPGEPAYFWLADEPRFRQIQILKKMVPPDLMLIAGEGALIAMPAANEYMEFSYKLFDAPREIDLRAEKTFDYGMENAKKLFDYGIEAIFTPSDIADNHGPFFNTEQMDRFILPYLSRWAKEVKAMGAYAILHSDGNLTPCLEAIADSGIDALQAIDPTAGMDIVKTKEQVGDRLCLCGNIDCGLVLTAAERQIYDAVQKLIADCRDGGGLVLGCSNVLQAQTPIENYMAIIQAWKDHGQY